MRLSRLLVLLASLVLTCASVTAQAHVGQIGAAAESARRGFLPDLGAASGDFARVTAGRVWENYDCGREVASALCVDAFGVEIGRTGSTDVEHLYRGEAFDPNVGFYYLRARWMDPSVGRFLTQDTYMGSSTDPGSLHKYIYANADPINGIDPSGYMTISEFGAAIRANAIILSRSVSVGARQFVRRAYSSTLRSSKEAARLARDCLRRPKRCNLIGPTLIVSGLDMPETASHIQQAQFGAGSAMQMGPAPFLLHYQNKPDRLREQALRPYKAPGSVCAGSSRTSFCDEYPFFKTREGSPRNLPGRVSLRLVPAAEQFRQGGLFNGMRAACGLSQAPIKKSRFLVVPLPDFELPSAFLCLK